MRVLVARGGVAALEALLAPRALAGDRVAIKPLAPNRGFLHQPMAVGSRECSHAPGADRREQRVISEGSA